jgi:hypothetical protein
MNIYLFSCYFEDDYWQMRALVYTNEYLFLYEVEPQDRRLFTRFGIKFITQPKEGFLDIRCSNSIKEHLTYEQAILTGLVEYLVSEKGGLP